MLDQQSGPAQGASFANGGYSQASVADPWNAPGVGKVFIAAWLAGLSGRGEHSAFVARTRALPKLIPWGLKFLRYANNKDYFQHTLGNSTLARYTLSVLDELDEIEKLSYSQSDVGGLIAFRDAAALSAYQEFTRRICGEDTPFEFLDREALLLKEPSLRGAADALVGAVFFPGDRAANSRVFCEQLAVATKRHGADLLFDQEVQKIESNSSGVQIDTNHDAYRADALVIAAGTASKSLAAQLGIRLPIAPAKGYSISVPMKDWKNRPRHVIADMGIHVGVNPMGEVLRVAGTAEFAGLLPGISEERVAYLLSLTQQLFPDFAATIDRREIAPWAGFRPLSADGMPILGKCSADNVYLNTGHGGLGWSQAAGSGKAVADQIMGSKHAVDISDFSIRRFDR